MRTLALAAAVSVCLGTSAAHALCTTGVECIRERFGPDTTVRNNRIIDRTDRLGDRGRPENPYLAGTNAAGQARRAGRFDSTVGGTTGAMAGRPRGTASGAEPPGPGDVGLTDRSAPGQLAPGEVGPDQPGASDLTIMPYEPASPAGAVGADTRGTVSQGTISGRSTQPAAAGSPGSGTRRRAPQTSATPVRVRRARTARAAGRGPSRCCR